MTAVLRPVQWQIARACGRARRPHVLVRFVVDGKREMGVFGERAIGNRDRRREGRPESSEQSPRLFLRHLPSALQTFMEHHVFAVWDFMSLVKALQAQLTCTSVPWTPRKHGRLGRFINEIVLGEESDVVGGREPTSHFELYLEAMDAVGANTGPIRHFVDAVDAGQPVEDALESAGAPPAAASFVRRTFDVIERGSVPEIASEFAIAREKVIPSMFRALIGRLEIGHRLNVAPLIEYLERHVELDGDEHGPLADELLETVCHEDNEKRLSAQQSALDALSARHRLWDEIATILKSKGEAPIAVETVVRGDLASKPEKFWMQIIGVVL